MPEGFRRTGGRPPIPADSRLLQSGLSQRAIISGGGVPPGRGRAFASRAASPSRSRSPSPSPPSQRRRTSRSPTKSSIHTPPPLPASPGVEMDSLGTHPSQPPPSPVPSHFRHPNDPYQYSRHEVDPRSSPTTFAAPQGIVPPSTTREQVLVFVFQCRHCRSIVADSDFWITAQHSLKFAVVSRVADVVRVLPGLITSNVDGPDLGSTYSLLDCKECDTRLGRLYRTTPRDLDDLREAYSLHIDRLAVYQLGQVNSGGPADPAYPSAMGGPSALFQTRPDDSVAPAEQGSSRYNDPALASNVAFGGDGRPWMASTAPRTAAGTPALAERGYSVGPVGDEAAAVANRIEMNKIRMLLMAMGERVVKLEKALRAYTDATPESSRMGGRSSVVRSSALPPDHQQRPHVGTLGPSARLEDTRASARRSSSPPPAKRHRGLVADTPEIPAPALVTPIAEVLASGISGHVQVSLNAEEDLEQRSQGEDAGYEERHGTHAAPGSGADEEELDDNDWDHDAHSPVLEDRQGSDRGRGERGADEELAEGSGEDGSELEAERSNIEHLDDEPRTPEAAEEDIPAAISTFSEPTRQAQAQPVDAPSTTPRMSTRKQGRAPPLAHWSTEPKRTSVSKGKQSTIPSRARTTREDSEDDPLALRVGERADDGSYGYLTNGGNSVGVAHLEPTANSAQRLSAAPHHQQVQHTTNQELPWLSESRGRKAKGSKESLKGRRAMGAR